MQVSPKHETEGRSAEHIPSHTMFIGKVHLHLQGLGIVIADPLITAPGSDLDHLLGVERDLGVEGFVFED